MFIQQLYTNCLAQAAYYIESNGEAVIIDPLRDIEQYTDLLKKRDAKLKYIFETHFHADFVSGHLDLAKQTGATIIFGPGATPAYTAYIAEDGDLFPLGSCKLKVLHTPGHTVESICLLLLDKEKKATALFSGDTLFVGDVGRPDLLSGNLSKETLASMLFDSLNTKIKTLPDDVILYPGHGPGSACGRSLGKETQSTIGDQKKLNYALQEMSRENFVAAVTKDQPIPPAYFFKDAAINKAGYEPLPGILKKEMKKLSALKTAEWIQKGALVLDSRDANEFSVSHVKGSINIGLNGQFAIWAGTLIDLNERIVIVCNEGKEDLTITRLARVGYENIVGFWNKDINQLAWENVRLAVTKTIDAKEMQEKYMNNNYTILDVRTHTEFSKDHVQRAVNIPLNELLANMNILDKNKPVLVYCAGGYRSMIAASILQKKGFERVINVKGGMATIQKLAPNVVEYAEVSKS